MRSCVRSCMHAYLCAATPMHMYAYVCPHVRVDLFLSLWLLMHMQMFIVNAHGHARAHANYHPIAAAHSKFAHNKFVCSSCLREQTYRFVGVLGH